MGFQFFGKATLTALFGLALMASGCGPDLGLVEADSSLMAVRSDAWSTAELDSQNLWTVLAPSGLNCRTEAREGAPIVYDALPPGTVLRAIDLIGSRGVDSGSYRWLQVVPLESEDHTPCFVAAHRPFLQRAGYDEVNWGSIFSIEGDVSCPDTFRNTVNVVQITTENHLIYLCADSSAPSHIRYYIAYDRGVASSEPALTLFAQRYNPDQGAYVEFYNQGYTYRIHKPSEFIKAPNLNVLYPDGRGYNEAILQWLD